MKKNKIFIFILSICIVISIGIFVFNKIKEQKEIERIELEEQQELNEVLELLEENIRGKIFLDINLSNEQIENIEKQLKQIKNIKKIEFISKEETLENMKVLLGEDLLEEYEGDNNIFPSSFEITLDFNITNINQLNYEYFNDIESAIYNINGIKEVEISIQNYVQLYKDYGLDKMKEMIEKANSK